MMSLTRRYFLTFTAAASARLAFQALPAAAAESQGSEELSDAEVAEILSEEGEPIGTGIDKAEIGAFWFQKPEGKRPSANWAQDNISFDYAHLPANPDGDQPFDLDAGVLKAVMAAMSFNRSPDNPVLLVALRGCLLADGTDMASYSKSQRIKAARPDHLNFRCLIGAWNTADDKIALFKASTVPNIDLMEKQIEGRLGCNLLPTGLHHYKVGLHNGSMRQPAAFIQDNPLWVHRAKKRLIYATNDDGNIWDDLDGKLPYDDIHAAILDTRKNPPYFSSAGCQTIPGRYKGSVPVGPWAEFRKAAGLAHPPVMVNATDTKDDNRKFDYMLVTGTDAGLASKGNLTAIRTLRFGSSGDLVAQLQEKLPAPDKGPLAKTGVVDRKTLGAIIRWQSANNMAPTGIVTPDMAKKLGLTWS
jgi:hypothetical protein